MACALSLSACGYSTSGPAQKIANTSAKCESTAIANQYVVRYKDGTQQVYKQTTKQALIEKVIKPNLEAIDFAEQDQRVSIPAEPVVLKAAATAPAPADWGQTRISANSAWSQNQTGQGVIVAVLDSGVDRSHAQLRNQIYVNPGETGLDAQGRDKATNGIDDDGNGFIDDVSGWDFDRNSNNVTDGTGHGTHVAGIIAAEAVAGSPVRGVAPSAKILPLDFMDDSGSGNISDAIRAMYYAAKMGAKVINASWGGAPCSRNLQTAIAEVGAAGVLFVSASGNRGVDLDVRPEYPAAFGMQTQVTVGASNIRDYATMYSNYSRTLVNLVAPGDEITSTVPDLRDHSDGSPKSESLVEVKSGTSMATPFVAGAAAVLFGAHPSASVLDVKAALLKSVDLGPYEVATEGRLNVGRALQEVQTLP